ncbi:acyl-coenzyme A synthetase/AMP-(fatty) acid ligase [Bradyrhizobium sp. USDA 10063]
MRLGGIPRYGCWNDPQATSESLKGGWFHTGDLMQRGEGDELLFVGRKKDIIIRDGTNISPVEVEQALIASHLAVVEAAVVGMPDATRGQRVIGFVKLAQGVEEASVSLIVVSLPGVAPGEVEAAVKAAALVVRGPPCAACRIARGVDPPHGSAAGSFRALAEGVSEQSAERAAHTTRVGAG